MECIFLPNEIKHIHKLHIFAPKLKKKVMEKKMKDVKFLPWEGANYQYGIRVDENGDIVCGTKEEPGKKVLVLGESFYTNKEEDIASDIMTQVMNWYFDPKIEFEGWMNTYTKFIRAFWGKFVYRDGSEEFWKSFVMYNYVQEPLRGTRFSPTTEQFEKSKDAFFEVLGAYKPDYVIVWGQRLYNNLPQEGEQGEDITVDDSCSETWVYKIENHNIRLLPIQHPSAGFSWSFWHEIIKAFLNLK